MKGIALATLVTLLLGCAHTGNRGTTTASARERQSVVPIYVYSQNEQQFEFGGPLMETYTACSATYVRSHLLVTHLACFRQNISGTEDSINVAYRTDRILIGDSHEATAQSVEMDFSNQLVFIRTSQSGMPLPLRMEPTLTNERLGKYAYNFSQARSRREVAPAHLVRQYPTSVDPDLFPQEPVVSAVLSIVSQTRPGELGGAVVNQRNQLVGILGGRRNNGRTWLISSQRIQEALADLPDSLLR